MTLNQLVHGRCWAVSSTISIFVAAWQCARRDRPLIEDAVFAFSKAVSAARTARPNQVVGRMNNTRRPLDPRICPVAIDANALDRDGSARDNLVDRLLGLSSAGTINLIVPKRVREEIQNPRTPAHVQEAALPKLFTIPVGLNSDEQRRRRAKRFRPTPSPHSGCGR